MNGQSEEISMTSFFFDIQFLQSFRTNHKPREKDAYM